jgi:hypothetical protein
MGILMTLKTIQVNLINVTSTQTESSSVQKNSIFNKMVVSLLARQKYETNNLIKQNYAVIEDN